jgi:rhamnosyltransferase
VSEVTAARAASAPAKGFLFKRMIGKGASLSPHAPVTEITRESPAGAVRPGTALPRVLVLLTAYNGSRYIREQIASILAQEGVNLTIAVRDDGSSDETRAEIARAARDSRIRVSRTSGGRSGSAAQNLFTLMRENAANKHDFVAFSDQDDLWHHDKLARACQLLTRDSAVGYSSATIAAWADGRQRILRQSGIRTRSDFLFEGAGQGCTFVLRGDFYSRVRHFVSRRQRLTAALHYHDWAVYALSRSWGLTWSFDPLPSMRYRQHESNDTGARRSMVGVTRRLALLRDGWYRTQLCGIAELCAAASPGNTTVAAWREVLCRPQGLKRRLDIARFCLDGGRRRRSDRAICIAAALLGWL